MYRSELIIIMRLYNNIMMISLKLVLNARKIS